jgi:two-component system chemotaxis response regulator CheY
MRVLLIDDEPMVRKIVRKMLERAGHAVVDVENGRTGLDQLERAAFDLIVTDIIMPDVEGIEVLMTVRERHPSIAVVAMSGGGRVGNVDFLDVARKLGAAATLEKPFAQDALLKAIDQSFGGQMVA